MCYLVLVIFLTMLTAGYNGEKTGGFCTETLLEKYGTRCYPCHLIEDIVCEGSVLEAIQNCTYENFGAPKQGCYKTCVKNVTVTNCCQGYWGDACQECPGGADTPCNNHGTCNSTSGNCICLEGWTGYACEFCTNKSSSANCTQDYSSKFCDDVKCPNNSQCLVLDGEPECVCQWPFVSHGPSSDNSSQAEKVCKEVDPCTIPPSCHSKANCTRGQEPGTKECACTDGYHGDGYLCDLTNPCQENYGGCERSSTQCVNPAPGKSECQCLRGYMEYVEGHGCSLVDICPDQAPTQCHSKATCVTIAVDNIRCSCPEGYIGDGTTCYGNLLQTMKDEHADGSQLGLFIRMVEKYYSEALTSHGPFTVFVPQDGGFRGTNTADFQKWLDDEGRVRQVLRQHIIIGDFTSDNLLNTTVFHTLQGTTAELFVANADVLKYRLMGSNRKANIVKGNIQAANGVIHVINRLMTNNPETPSNKEVSIHELIANNGKYNRLQTYISAAGEEVSSLLMSNNVTMFAPNNAALDALPAGSLDFLTSPQGREKLLTILKNHIVPKVVDMATLINILILETSAKFLLSTKVSYTGQLVINGNVNITQADIMGKNGLLFDIDGVLLPDNISPLPNRCDDVTYNLVEGPCGDCREKLKCNAPDIETPEQLSTVCNYFARNLENKYEKTSGCALMCNRTYTNTKCCDNFYGFDCLSCPGGYKTPCSGNGKCNDGYYSNGTCSCDEGFMGVACEKCSNPRHFGPNCSQECTCIHGDCDAGPTGSGKCITGRRCNPSHFWGDDCDRFRAQCKRNLYCHAHSLCILGGDFNFSCVCNTGYTGNGEKCDPVNPCVLSDFGGCHRQAACMMTGPGQNNCTCRPGWSGDGSYCYPATSCSNHGNCHKEARCLETVPGELICQCNPGYHGNGTYCVLTDMCTDNNGGCHSKATCVPTGPGRVNCTCPADQGYYGSGYSCYGNLVKQIEDHPQLSFFAMTLQKFKERDVDWLLENDYTVFAPNNAAVKEFSKSIGVKHWLTVDNCLDVLGYHSLMNASTLSRLYPIAQYMGKLETMTDGFHLHLDKNGTENYVIRSGLGIVANVLEADIIAVNGYLNIIDKVLEPYAPTNPDDYPDLEGFFEQHPKYSIFGQWLKDKKMLTMLEDQMQQYTLFVPTNDAIKREMNRTVTTDLLKYYMLSIMLETLSLTNGEVLPTVLGFDHQLVFDAYSLKNTTINKVPIVEPDMWTFGGIVHGIDGLLHPVLHSCNEIVKIMDYGACVACGPTHPCPKDYLPYAGAPGGGIQECEYTAKSPFSASALVRFKGCQGLCVKEKQILGCCSGHFGTDCQECPGGPEIPCSGHGTCDDKINGTGRCTCRPRFMGSNCDICTEGWDGPNCNIDTSSCQYMNGGCHSNALCFQHDDGSKICKCKAGYRGNGYTCTGPCDVDNGGCHRLALCHYKPGEGVSCQCLRGFVGDGKKQCNADIFSTLASLNDTQMFLKSLNKMLPHEQLARLQTHSQNGTKFTVFVPVNDGGKNRIISKQTLLQQLVEGPTSVVLTPAKAGDQRVAMVTTMAGQNVTVIYNPSTAQYFVNGILVTQENIPCTNGILHLVAAPFTRLELESSSSPPLASIIGPVLAVIIIATVVVVILILYRKSHEGYWEVLQKWLPQRKGYAPSFSHGLGTRDNEKRHEQGSGLPSANTNFDNPLFKEDALDM